MPVSPQINDMIYIKWMDSTAFSNGWIPLQSAKDLSPSYIESVGFVIKVTCDYITIAAHKTSTTCNKVQGEMTIPWGAISKHHKLSIKKD
jgi:hypothetical protein